jgi:hypothetical protein
MITLLSFLSLAYSFDIAYENSSFALWTPKNESYYSYNFDLDNESIGTTFDIEARYGDKIYGYIGGSTYISAVMTGGNLVTETSPEFGDFGARFGVRSKHWDAGYEYHCVHPILAYMDDTQVASKREGAFWKVHVKFTGEWRYK